VDIKPFRYLLDARDRSLIEFDLPINAPGMPGTSLTVIVWDEDRDSRLGAVIAALRFRSPMLLLSLTAIMEHRGVMDFWCPSTADAAALTRALQAAADAALQPRDRWHVNPPTVIPVKNGRPDWKALRENDPVRAAVIRYIAPKLPEQFPELQDGGRRGGGL
jgi:hypothetical protein